MLKVMDDVNPDEDEVEVLKKKVNKKTFGGKTTRKLRIGQYWMKRKEGGMYTNYISLLQSVTFSMCLGSASIFEKLVTDYLFPGCATLHSGSSSRTWSVSPLPILPNALPSTTG